MLFPAKRTGFTPYVDFARDKPRAGPPNKVLTDSHIYDTLCLDKEDIRRLPEGFEV
jgi:hypothetical protein